uniref:Ig-like domain-containing protein n=1 Tax=Pedobacter sp. TaxID=1411316 RepID=UPI00396C9647
MSNKYLCGNSLKKNATERLFKVSVITLLYLLFCCSASAQICGTSGIDGPSTNANPVNTYYPVPLNKDVTLSIGSTFIFLDPVPLDDPNYGNSYGKIGIRAGDLILIIQMQDAIINFENNNLYGAGNNKSGPDNLGGTGYTGLGFSGKYEYVIATNNLPLTGGTLTFKGANNGGTINEYNNSAATGNRGQRRFQIVRVPQYSNLVLTSNVTTPPYNGRAGGVIAFDVAGTMSFGGYKIDASERGFRGGYAPKLVGIGENLRDVYVGPSSINTSVGKGEGIAGTPRFMYDGFNQVDNGSDGLPGGSSGKGAPANAGGGGNNHNAGGGGGANGGDGGVGGDGWAGAGGTNPTPNGGRPGTKVPIDITRLIMGGGGGGGNANDALSGVIGGVGGGIVLINVERILGNGTILANGGNGKRGALGNSPDGAGGGGAGGTIFVRSLANSAGATLTLEANGGVGGNTANDKNNEHGPGGGAGGGMIYYNVPGAVVFTKVDFGKSGKADDGKGIPHGAADGKAGAVYGFSNAELPNHLKGGGKICYPELTVTLSEAKPGIPGSRNPGSTAVYTLTISNSPNGGNAGDVLANLNLPPGFTISSITANLTGNASGPLTPSFTQTGNVYSFGSYNISPGDQVIFTINVNIANTVSPGMHHTSAQATYLDPTRTFLNPDRRITPFQNALSGANTNYESGDQANVAGINYNGNLPTSVTEDVHINAKPKPNDLTLDVIECDDKAAGQLTATDPDEVHTPQNLVYSLEGTYDTTKGTLTLNADGTFLFLPATRFFGTITIKFRVTDRLGAYDIGTLIINQPKPLIYANPTIGNISCFGGSDGNIIIDAGGGVGTLTYSWTGPDSFSSTNKDISNLKAGTYYLKITDANNCSITEEYKITQPALITAAESHTVIDCNGGTSTVTLVANGGNGSYQYTFNGITNTTGIFANVTAGTY